MNLFGIKIDLKAVATTAAPVILGALLTHRSVKAAAIDAAKAEIAKRVAPRA